MLIRNLILIAVLSAFLLSCSNDKTIYIKTTYGYGIGPKTRILLNGTAIGEITDLKIIKDVTVFEASIHSNIQLPKDSKCFVEKWDLLTNVVTIKKGKSKQLLADGGTLHIVPNPRKPDFTIDDETIEKAKEFLKEITGVNQRDSMIEQLDRLNHNLEEIDKELNRFSSEK